MMFSNGLAFAVKVGGKILREVGDKVYIPFGSEYSLIIKNQKQERALVHISIDGQAIDNGGGFIIDGKSTAEIERFVKNLDKGNKLKFIERTKKIEDGKRGIKIDDGLITVDFQFEKPAPKITEEHVYRKTVVHDVWDYPRRYPPYWHGPFYGGSCGGFSGGGGGGGSGGAGGAGGGAGGSITRSLNSGATFNSVGAKGLDIDDSVSTMFCSTGSTGMPTMDSLISTNDVGITVPGSLSNQQFQTGYIWNLESNKYTMIVHLLGTNEQGAPIQEAFTVKSKKVCTTCGTHNNHDANFCRDCGTALNIV